MVESLSLLESGFVSVVESLSLLESGFETNSNALSGKESLEVPSGVEVFDFTNQNGTAVGLLVVKCLDMIQDELGSLAEDSTKVNQKVLGVNTWMRSSMLNNGGYCQVQDWEFTTEISN